MKTENKKILILIFLIFTQFKNSLPTLSFDGSTSNFDKQTSTSRFFFTPSSLNISSEFENGFQIPAGKTILFESALPISGLFDLSGTLSLGSDLYLDSNLTYSGIGQIAGNGYAIHLGGNLTIPTSNFFHIGSDTIIEGHGNSINLFDNAEILIDDNVTLTLRNIVINSSKNGVGNPAIKLTSNRSKLALDNTVLSMANDFYVNRGQLFIHNDVSFSGTNSLVYQSPMPSFITSKSTLNFDLGTTFSVCPATFTDCPYSTFPTTTTNNFILMKDQTSQLYLNGCSLLTTLTGCRFTTGSLLFDNKVSLNSRASFDLASTTTTPITFITSQSTEANAHAIAWSPDGRFVAVTSASNLQVYSFNGLTFTQVGSTVSSEINQGRTVTWSPDGRFIAFVNSGNNTSNVVAVYSFNKTSTPTLFSMGNSAVSGSGPYWCSWSPDGRYIAVVYYQSNKLEIFSTGTSNLTSIGNTSTGTTPISISWSPDGKYLAVLNNGSTTLQIFNVSTVTAPSAVGSTSISSSPWALAWSPDERFIAVAHNSSPGSLDIYRFFGSRNPYPVKVGSSITTGNTASSVTWSPSGNFFAVTCYGVNSLGIYKFDGATTPTQIDSNISTANNPNWVSWTPDGLYIAIANEIASGKIQVFRVNQIVDYSTQSLSNSIVFGNSALSSSYDLNVRCLSGAQVEIDGLVNYDNVS
ncbi:MAG: beta-propeller fold lactonase family protein [Candidatus Babeliales bacterium]|jgi:WD40 repeat protein